MGLTILPRELACRAAAGTLAHGYILAGARRDRVEEMATALAAAMLCNGPGESRPCGVCRSCRKAAAGSHPDVIWAAPEEGKEFSVAQARALRSDAYMSPNEGARKVYLIRDAQRMNVSAQNALLKVLEEGPPYAAFLFLTDNPSALLETIRSRCETVNLAGAPGEGDKTDALGRELAELLLTGERWAVLERCVPLEKGKREETLALWEAMGRALVPLAARGGGRKAAQLLAELGEVQAQARLNVNLGALWGRLYALAG